jgi:hypothetical protein
MVSNTRQVFDPTASDKYYSMLLKVMAFAADVSPNFMPVG